MQLTNEPRSLGLSPPVVLAADGAGKPGGRPEDSGGHGRGPASGGRCLRPTEAELGRHDPPTQAFPGCNERVFGPIPVHLPAPSPAGILVCSAGHPSSSRSWETAGTLPSSTARGFALRVPPAPSRFRGLPEDRGGQRSLGAGSWLGEESRRAGPGFTGRETEATGDGGRRCRTPYPACPELQWARHHGSQAWALSPSLLGLTVGGRTKTGPGQDAGDPAPSRHSGGACLSESLGSLAPAAPRQGA